MKLRVMGYCRVSTDEQAETGYSLEAQRRAIEEFARQKGWQLGPIYTDAGISGQLDQRPALTKLLEEATNGHCDVVVVHAIDRFYRSLTGLLTAIELLRRNGVGFVSITENLDFTTPWGKLALVVLGTLAEIYIEKLRRETKKGRKARAQVGMWNGSIPFGYCNGCCSNCTDPNGPGYCPHVGEPDRNNDTPLIGHPLEKIGVRRAYKLSASGLYSDRDIAGILNEQIVRYHGQEYILRPKRRPGDIRRFGEPVFVKDTIREMLLRPFYTGVVAYLGTKNNDQKRKRQDAVALYPGKHPALIPQSLFDQVQVMRKIRTNVPLSKGKRLSIFPLSGLLRCGGCGKMMRTASNHQGQRYYRCATRIQLADQCDQPTVWAAVLEEQLVERFRQIRLATDWQERLRQAIIPDEEKQARRQSLQQSLKRARELYLEGDLDREEYERKRAVYRESLADLTDARFPDMIATGYLVQNFVPLWERQDDNLKKKLLRSLLAAVTVRADALNGWTPNSAFYPLLRHALSFLHEAESCHYGN